VAPGTIMVMIKYHEPLKVLSWSMP
jgi:hypothetical protein